MKKEGITRRLFLKKTCGGIGSAWVMTHWAEILAAQEHAHRVAQSTGPAKLEYFTPEQAAEIEAISAQIIPTDETVGARQARVINFIDQCLATFALEERRPIARGLKELPAKIKRISPKAQRVSDLTNAQQIKLLKGIERSDFFETVRTMTIIGFLANPEYGGNKDFAGWKLIGFEDEFAFSPPFGFYDSPQTNSTR